MYTHVEARDTEMRLLVPASALMAISASIVNTSIVHTVPLGIPCPKWHILATQNEWHVPIWETATTALGSARVVQVMKAALARDPHVPRGLCYARLLTPRKP